MNPSQSKRQIGQDDFVGGELDADLWKDSDIFIYIFGWKSWEFHCYVRFTAGQEGWLDLGKLQDHCWVVNMVREALKSKIHGVEEAVRSTTKETRKPLQRIAYMKLSRYPWLCHYVSQLFGDQQKTHLGLREFIHQHLANLGAFFFFGMLVRSPTRREAWLDLWSTQSQKCWGERLAIATSRCENRGCCVWGGLRVMVQKSGNHQLSDR